MNRVLVGQEALLVIDNLETFRAEERDRVMQFLERLPPGNKAIVTSRRRPEVGVHIVRLDRLKQADAFKLMEELAGRNPRLARTSADERQTLYEVTGATRSCLSGRVGSWGAATAARWLRRVPFCGMRRPIMTHLTTFLAIW